MICNSNYSFKSSQFLVFLATHLESYLSCQKAHGLSVLRRNQSIILDLGKKSTFLKFQVEQHYKHWQLTTYNARYFERFFSSKKTWILFKAQHRFKNVISCFLWRLIVSVGLFSKALWQRKRDENELVSDTVSSELTLSGPQVQLAQDISLRFKSDDVLGKKLMALFSSLKLTRLKYQDVIERQT